jgi:hypothetical protein
MVAQRRNLNEQWWKAALGQERRFHDAWVMSAYPPTADI